MKKVLSIILAVALALSVYSEVAVAQFGGGGAFGDCANYLKVVGTSIIPNATGAYDLGSAAKAFRTIYVGSITPTGNITMATGTWIGLGAAKGRIVFTDAAADLLNFINTAVKIGTGVPTITQADDDLYVTGRLEVDSAAYFAGITSGRVSMAGTNGVLTDDADLTFSGSTLTVGSTGTGQDGALALASEQGATDYTATLLANTAMTANSSFYLPVAVPAASSNMVMSSGGVMSNATYAQILTVDANGTMPNSYTTVTAALNAITDATTSKRYCIKVMPGTYVEAITMKAYVDVVSASGNPWDTIISQTDATVVTMATRYNTLRGFTVSLTAPTGAKSVIYSSVSFIDNTIENCKITMAGNFDSIGIDVNAPTTNSIRNNIIRNNTILGTSNSYCYGIKYTSNNNDSDGNRVDTIESNYIGNVKYGVWLNGTSQTTNITGYVLKNNYIGSGTDCVSLNASTDASSSYVSSYNNTYITGTIRITAAATRTSTFSSYGDTIPSITKAGSGGTETFNAYGSVVGGDFVPVNNTTFLRLEDNIETAVTNATAGDTLVLASGTYTITDDIDIAKAINIVGQGVGKTTIACATATKNVFHITSDNVRIANLTISITANNDYGVYADASGGTMFSGLVFEGLNITGTGVGNLNGIYCLDAHGTFRNIYINLPALSIVYGIYLDYQATSEGVGTSYLYNVNVIANSTGGVSEAGALYHRDNGTAADQTIYVYNSSFQSISSAAADWAVKVRSSNAIGYFENCTINSGGTVGTDYDLYMQTSPAYAYLRDCVLVNGLTTGTVITYSGYSTARNISDKFITCTEFTSTGINAAIDALGTTGGEVYLPEGDYDLTATITIDANNTTLRGSGKGTRLLATNRTTFASYTGTPAAGETLTGVTSTYTAVIEKVDLVNLIVWYHTLNNATNFTTGETLNCSGGGTLVNIAACTEQSFHAVTTNGKYYTTIRDLAIVGGSGGGNSNNLIGAGTTDDDYLTVSGCHLSRSDNRAISSAGEYENIIGNYVYDIDQQGIMANGSYCIVSDNNIESCGDSCIYSGANATISNNFILSAEVTAAIYGAGATNTIVGNTILNSATDGVFVTTNNNTISGNNISGTATAYNDIKVTADYNSIVGNSLFGNGVGDTGIYLDEADYCTVVGNVTLGHDVAGIQINSDCQNTTLGGNNCSDTTPYVNNGTAGNYQINDDLELVGSNVRYLTTSDNIETAIAAATAGDTLILAAGTYTITDDIDVTVGVNIVGQGIGKTTVTCATASKNVFHTTVSNVRIADMTITNSGGTGYAVNAGAACNGLVLTNLAVSVSGAGPNIGIYLRSTDATLRDVTVVAASSDDIARGVHVFNNTGDAAAPSTINAYNVSVSSTGSGSEGSSGFTVYNVNLAQLVTLNLYTCNATAASAGTNDAGLYLYSNTTFNAVANAYNCTFSGADYDVENTTTNTLKLSGCTLANNKITGTVDFGTNDAWSNYAAATYTWGTTDATVSSSVYRYKVDNGKCFFSIQINISDGNDSTGLLTATLPITPRDNNNNIPVEILGIDAAGLCYHGRAKIDATTPAGIVAIAAEPGAFLWYLDTASGFSPYIIPNGAASTILISGVYEV